MLPGDLPPTKPDDLVHAGVSYRCASFRHRSFFVRPGILVRRKKDSRFSKNLADVLRIYLLDTPGGSEGSENPEKLDVFRVNSPRPFSALAHWPGLPQVVSPFLLVRFS
jgi:hypothetical protein